MKQILINAIGDGKTGTFPAFIAHFAKLGPRNIFNRWYKTTGIMTIKDKSYEND